VDVLDESRRPEVDPREHTGTAPVSCKSETSSRPGEIAAGRARSKEPHQGKRGLPEKMLAEEERHVDWTRAQQEAIKQICEQNSLGPAAEGLVRKACAFELRNARLAASEPACARMCTVAHRSYRYSSSVGRAR
jgi:hypothetical protein